MQRNVELEATIVAKYAAVSPVLDERSRRRWAATESLVIGYGGDALVSSATGLARETIRERTPGNRARRGADGSDTASGRRAAPCRTEPARSAVRPRSAGGPADARRPDLAVALDLQESGEAGRGADPTGVAREFDHRRPVAARLGLPAAIGPQASGGSEPPGPQCAVRAHQRDRGRVSGQGAAGDLGRHEEEGIGRKLQERRAGMASEGHAAVGAGA